jgi:hypothetical protein
LHCNHLRILSGEHLVRTWPSAWISPAVLYMQQAYCILSFKHWLGHDPCNSNLKRSKALRLLQTHQQSKKGEIKSILRTHLNCTHLPQTCPSTSLWQMLTKSDLRYDYSAPNFSGAVAYEFPKLATICGYECRELLSSLSDLHTLSEQHKEISVAWWWNKIFITLTSFLLLWNELKNTSTKKQRTKCKNRLALRDPAPAYFNRLGLRFTTAWTTVEGGFQPLSDFTEHAFRCPADDASRLTASLQSPQ